VGLFKGTLVGFGQGWVASLTAFVTLFLAASARNGIPRTTCSMNWSRRQRTQTY